MDGSVYFHPGPKAHVRKVHTPAILRYADQDPASMDYATKTGEQS